MIHGTPRGFRDILPEEAQAREALADTVRGGLCGPRLPAR